MLTKKCIFDIVKEYKTDMSIDELKAYPKLFPKKGIFMPVFAKLKTDKIIFYSFLCFAKLKLHDEKEFVFIELKHTCNIIFYIIIMLFVFLSFNLFRENIIINGVYNPEITDRLIGFGIMFLLFSMITGMYYRFKTDFIDHIEKELNLKQIIN